MIEDEDRCWKEGRLETNPDLRAASRGTTFISPSRDKVRGQMFETGMILRCEFSMSRLKPVGVMKAILERKTD